MFQIDLDSNGELLLTLPGPRSLTIPATVGGLQYIKKIISEHHRGVRGQRGYIGTLPTQHNVDKAFADKFLAEKKIKTDKEKRDALQEKLDIDWDKLEINL